MDNVKTMFSARFPAWHKIGTVTAEALNSTDALIAAGLNHDILSKEIFVDGKKVAGYKANVSSDNGEVLGIVTNRYKIVQNREAFDFTDSLFADGEIKYETAGALGNGHRVWMLAKMPTSEMIAGDKIDPFLVFTNSHDGKGGMRASITPVRVVCQNTLYLALRNASRSWSSNHVGDIKGKMIAARQTLGLAKEYMVDLGKIGNKMATEKIDNQYVVDMSKILFPTSDQASKRTNNNQAMLQDDFLTRWQCAPDLANFRDTKWGALQAATDAAMHGPTLRETENGWENAFMNLLNGNNVIDKAYEYVLRK